MTTIAADPRSLRVAFTEGMNLAAAELGSSIVECTDAFFAGCENLLKPEAPVFKPDVYTADGKWMDGWESRRRRLAPGQKLSDLQDSCVIRLGVPGEIEGVNVDTSFFTGNYPEYARLEACEGDTPSKWVEILPKVRLQGGIGNLFSIRWTGRATHLRLTIYPDGGVARLRVYGRPKPGPAAFEGVVDTAQAVLGGRVLGANDAYFGRADQLLYPGRARTMGEGWETRRRRGPGEDWVVVELARPTRLERLELDTHHFKGNFPDRVRVDALSHPARGLLACDVRDREDLGWQPLLRDTRLQADHVHSFSEELTAASTASPIDYLRVTITPDGGISRLRAWGRA